MSRVFGVKEVLRKCQGSVMEVLRICQGCVEDLSRKYQESVQEVKEEVCRVCGVEGASRKG